MLNVSSRKINGSTLIFVVSYFVYLFAAIWAQTEFKTTYDETIVNMFQRVAILLVVVKIFQDRTAIKKNLPFWVCFLGLFFVIAIMSGNYTYVIPIAAYILAGSNIDSDTLIRTALYALITMCILTVISSLLGIIPYEYTVTSTGRTRYALGFLYTTYLANYFFHGLLMWIFLKKRCPNIVESVIVLLINYVIYFFTNTRAVFYEVIIMLAVCWVARLIKKELAECKMRYIFLASFPLCAIISMAMQINYNSGSGWMYALNILLSYRLSLGHSAYNRYGFSILGQEVEWESFNSTSGTYFYVDSSYLNISINYGVILLILLLVGFIFLMRRYIRENHLYCCIVLLFLAIHSMSDPQLFSLICNPFMFLLGSFFPFSMKPRRSIKIRNDHTGLGGVILQPNLGEVIDPGFAYCNTGFDCDRFEFYDATKFNIGSYASFRWEVA